MSSLLDLNREWHARPGLRIKAGQRVVHMLTRRDEVLLKGAGVDASEHLADPHGVHFIAHTDAFTVKWEGHTEASCYTFLAPARQGGPFTGAGLDFLASEPAEAFRSAALLGVRIDTLKAGADASDGGHAQALALLGGRPVFGGLMSDGHAAVWSDFQPDGEGFLRYLIVDIDLSEGRRSRLVQRLLDIETYRFLAIRALPVARQTMAQLDDLEPRLDALVAQLGQETAEGQEALLKGLIDIAGQAEHIVSTTAYRFAAARAYEDIVARRLAEVREEILGGHQRISVFIDKTFRPAMRTCEAAALRAEGLTGRVARAVNLLNTLVDMEQKCQSQGILRSLDSQAATQTRLQQAVEGFSVFAISYYAVGLLGYLLKALKEMGVPVPANTAPGLAVIPVLLVSWLAIRTVKRRLTDKAS